MPPWFSRRWAAMALAVLLGTGLPSACDKKPRLVGSSPTIAALGTFAHAHRVALDKISAGLLNPAAVKFRGVQVYDQVDANVIAVCGQVNPNGREDQAFIPFVSVITYTVRPDAGLPEFDIEQYVATSTSEATRMYIEMASRCGENGGPRQVGNRKVIPPLSPLPSDLANQLQPDRQPGTGRRPVGQFVLTTVVAVPGRQVEPLGTPFSGQSVVMRQAGNIRIASVGGSQLVRVAPRGAVLKVSAQASGGWLQVGEGEPEGWVHSSLVEKR